MTGEEFLKQVLEPSTKKVGTEVPYGMMSTLRRYMNHDPHTAPQPHQGNKGNKDKRLFCISLYQLFCKNVMQIEKLLFYLPGMSYSYSENHYNESKDQEEETVLEEIMRKAAIGRYVVYY